MHSALLTVHILSRLQEWDSRLFRWLNQALVNPVFDTVLPLFRESVFWAPLYLFILSFVFVNYGKKGLWWAVAFLATVALSDLAGTYLFKENFQRIRPCNEPELAGQVRLIIKSCPGGYSFLSNHAANHFGLATFMVLTFRPRLRLWVYLPYLWALLISFAQLYVGVHYPTDILGGAILGLAAGYTTASFYRRNFGPLTPLT